MDKLDKKAHWEECPDCNGKGDGCKYCLDNPGQILVSDVSGKKM
jgi:hypothetical protein